MRAEVSLRGLKIHARAAGNNLVFSVRVYLSATLRVPGRHTNLEMRQHGAGFPGPSHGCLRARATFKKVTLR